LYSQRWITRGFAIHARKVNLLAGLLLVGMAFYDLAQNWEIVRGISPDQLD